MRYNPEWSKFSSNLNNSARLYNSYYENLGAHNMLKCAEETGTNDDSCEKIANIYDDTKFILDMASVMPGVGEA